MVFRSAASVFAVCAYCQSTLVRHDQELADIGKMAALAEDRSPLQLGSEGYWQGLHFALIGRIQLRYDQGLWNEWHLLFDDQRTGWLSEAAGEYVLSFLHPVQEPLPDLSTLQVAQRLSIASRSWTVTDIEEAECVAGQGELPFRVGAGYRAPVVDLRSGDNFATLDYSEQPPLLFIGSAVAFSALGLSRLRQGLPPPERAVAAKVFRCPGCGAPMTARSAEILAVGCGSCGLVVDAADENFRVLSRALGPGDECDRPRLPLGSQGMLEGHEAEVIGFLVKEAKADGVPYAWREYLLAGANGSYRWLTEYDGHWNVAEVLSRHPAAGAAMADIHYAGQRYRHFATSQAQVVQVAGEFTWRVQRGETSAIADYVAPPLLLSRERSSKEVSWSLGHYVEPEVVRAAFRLPAALPEPSGVYANQPNPWEETHGRVCKTFWLAALAAVVVHGLLLFLAGGQILLRDQLNFLPEKEDETLVTRSFEIQGKARKLVVRNATDLNNNWIGLNIDLVNKTTGAAWPAARELSYYTGVDDGESWSEGNRNDEVVFVDIPPGTYYLAIDAGFPDEAPRRVRSTVEVATGAAGWSNLVLLLVFLALFPIFTRLRRGAFEIRRWLESDHAPVSDDGDD